jgi:hypothetical protein
MIKPTDPFDLLQLDTDQEELLEFDLGEPIEGFSLELDDPSTAVQLSLIHI